MPTDRRVALATAAFLFVLAAAAPAHAAAPNRTAGRVPALPAEPFGAQGFGASLRPPDLLAAGLLPNAAIAVAPATRGAVPAAALSPQRLEACAALAAEINNAPAELPAEAAKGASDRIFEPGFGAAAPGAVADPAPSDSGRPYRIRTGAWEGLKDRYRYSRLLGQNYHWYTVTHMRELWPSYRGRRLELIAQGEAPAVHKPRAFFAHMRSFGQSGIFYVLGFSALRDGLVLAESRRAYAKFFTGPALGPAQAEAFEGFLSRISGFNAEHRAHSNLRKHIRDALLAASVMPARAIASFFDSLTQTRDQGATEEFQRAEAPKVVAAFRGAVMRTLAEEPDSPDRVLGVVLMGSFARGAATPTSDLDIELLAHDGRSANASGFSARLLERWRAMGLQQRHPITPHRHPMHPSPKLMARVHSDSVLVFAEDEAIAAALTPAPGAPPSFSLVRDLTWRGRMGRWLHFGAVYAVTLWPQA
ncbi:MAG: nucleotidyltransferase domain-containing protein [Elusimicrobia bacterium]|nr:nucleotidyltransferase domain-containing protein [Elusimicrobiota bacterium]